MKLGIPSQFEVLFQDSYVDENGFQLTYHIRKTRFKNDDVGKMKKYLLHQCFNSTGVLSITLCQRL